MRLLEHTSGDEFVLTEDFIGNDKIPPYAILSHTWEDDQEVTFSEFTDGTGKSKTGYEKIRFCGQQAKRDGLRHFWVDTCCIDKSDPAELREAINSMFRWYQNAVKCYVYLSDVSTLKRRASDEVSEFTWERAFRDSRWFTRGWTLQELLAPSSVEFFSQEWERLGDKGSLKQQIHKITGIPQGALQGVPLSQFSVNERLSWKENRRTKLKEDRAYSLLGIFGVHIAPMYGEGAREAFRRLLGEVDKLGKCIQDLHLTDPRDDKKRIEETKGGLLEGSYCWILNNASFQQWLESPQSRLLWIKGDPGKGKTMLLCGIIEEIKKSTPGLLSFFFCQGTDSRINSATAVLRGLIYLLVNQQLSLAPYLRKKYDQVSQSIFEDANAWVALSDIFMDMIQDPDLKTTYLVVDALDECMADLPKFLDLVHASVLSARVKWLLSSRNEIRIEQKLRRVDAKARLSLELKQNAEEVSRAVDVYIDDKLSRLESLEDNSLRNQVRDILRRKANGTFLWVSLVVQELEGPESWDPLQVVEEAPLGLHQLYDRMLNQIQRLKERNLEICLLLLSIACVAYRPLYLAEIGTLCGLSGQVSILARNVRIIVAMCGSFLTVRDDQVYFIHQSAKDYLSDKMRDPVFPFPSQRRIHHNMFSQSLKLMSSALKRDMYGLVAPGFPVDRVPVSVRDPLTTIRYSCIYWVDHLYDLNSNSTSHGIDSQDKGAIENFIRTKYLYWLEALSLCRSMSEGVLAIAKLNALAQRRADAPNFIKLLQDARLFIMYHIQAIQNSPLQVYVSALIFSPDRSLIRSYFKEEEPEQISIKPAIGDQWSACLQTLEGHGYWVRSVAFSQGSTRLASASADKTVKIWDASSGECLQTLEGHIDWVNSVAFSHDSARLASASDDKTVKIWDASSGECIQKLEGYRDSVKSVVFSHNSARLASASADKVVKIWDASNGECLQTLEGHSDSINSVAFSYDSARLASASDDKTVKIWDANSGVCLQTLEGHSNSVNSVAFSHDSAKLASASDDKTVKIWDASSSKCLQTLEGHIDWVRSVVFSHDSAQLASASADKTVKIWDASSGECLHTLEGHGYWVNSVAFSHDSARLASASDDRTVKIWDASSSECFWDASSSEYLQTLEGHSDSVNSMAFSHDSAKLASASDDKTVKIWDASSGECIQTLEGHGYWVNSVAFSHDSARLASASDDKTVRIWDASSSECLHTLEGHSDWVRSVAFSHDSAKLASASADKTVRIWDASSSKCLQTLEGHSNWVRSVAFSHDSARLASASADKTVKIWDASSGECLHTLEGHSYWVNSVAFSHDSTRLASASADKTVKIWDASSGECLRTLIIGQALFRISFDITGLNLQTDIGTIKISALSGSESLPSRLEPQSPQYQRLGLNTNGVWITYNAENLIWLPSEYRRSCSVVSEKIISIGTRTGRVWICKVELN